MMFSPLEQFEILNILPILFFNNTYLSITNSTIFTLLSLTLIIVVFHLLTLTTKIIPTRWQLIIEEIFLFTKTLIIENIGSQGLALFPFIFFLFLFLITTNLIGLIPYSFTITSHLFITFSLALTLFIGINIIAIKKHKLHFFGFFLPNGVNLLLAPLLVPIELISYIARVFSLSIRLFANMMSGHTLLKIVAGFAWTMLSLGGIWYLVHLIPLVVIILVTILELGIAFLQAYVFTILICLYIKDALYLSH